MPFELRSHCGHKAPRQLCALISGITARRPITLKLTILPISLDGRVRQWKCLLDEVYAKITGKMHYLWRAVDQAGEILESYVTKARDKQAALTFMKKALKRHGSSETITTTGLVPTRRRSLSQATPKSMRWDAGLTTGRRTAIWHSEDENERCSCAGR
jgi:hypothetical protein